MITYFHIAYSINLSWFFSKIVLFCHNYMWKKKEKIGGNSLISECDCSAGDFMLN